MITDERRAFRRACRAFNLRYSSEPQSGCFTGSAVTRNISPGGVYFECLSNLPIGAVLDCRLDVMGKVKELRFLARVVRCDPSGTSMVPAFGVAAEFVRSYGKSESELRKILASS